ncbi:TetR/AcrR family transcriptional regulator [Amycolatopsis acidicola]|uniref:TetR/AcrR family transcriptional regulator n=1 Tax=Amycolatopsis acidicola TaxID=2596893 RepID=A0A5N0UQV1_9PSEU|nr:TetR/AcrR family transcriptional regulator [Amycolatopsis acidicola]KAA9150738.1 TetR/AcrR family transcriptional regulator [Amycolatopsis acidicola]
MSTDAVGARRRGRSTRPTGDDRENAILATAEKLLETRPLREISIDDLARGAGISRPTFYFYFRSKDAVLLALLERVVDEADSSALDMMEESRGDAPQAWRACINVFYETFSSHRAVALAIASARETNPAVRELWSSVMDRWVDRIAAVIESERARGAAPPGRPARDLAVALNLMNERMLHAAFAGERPMVPESEVVDVLLEIWLAAIYR